MAKRARIMQKLSLKMRSNLPNLRAVLSKDANCLMNYLTSIEWLK